MSASDRGWGPGWPTSRLADQVPLEFITGRIHKDIHDLVHILCKATISRGYKIRKDWSWGYASRPIGGTRTPSNHSWGLAVDINAPTNPQKSPLTTDMPSWLPILWKNYGFRWGGDYRPPSIPDTMHFEFMGTPEDARELTRLARLEFGDASSPAPKTKESFTMERLAISDVKKPTGTKEGWKTLQSLLAARGFPPSNTFDTRGRPDGIAGPGTREALGKFQTAEKTGFVNSPSKPDYIVGMGTWDALLGRA